MTILMTSTWRHHAAKKCFTLPTQEFKRLSSRPVVAQGHIYYTFLNISVTKLVKIGNKLSLYLSMYLCMYLSIYLSGTKPQGLFKTDPLSVPASWNFFKHLFSQKIDLLHVSDDSVSIWAKQIFIIFWWNTRLRLTMGAITYVHFLNPLIFCITGYKWTSLRSMVISEWLVCLLWCSKVDTFRKNP